MGLGKGLDQIFGEDLTRVLDEIQNDETSIKHEIKLTEIRANPYQPRVQFDKEKLNELAESIKEHGVFTPILVRKAINGWDRQSAQAAAAREHSLQFNYDRYTKQYVQLYCRLLGISR